MVLINKNKTSLYLFSSHLSLSLFSPHLSQKIGFCKINGILSTEIILNFCRWKLNYCWKYDFNKKLWDSNILILQISISLFAKFTKIKCFSEIILNFCTWKVNLLLKICLQKKGGGHILILRARKSGQTRQQREIMHFTVEMQFPQKITIHILILFMWYRSCLGYSFYYWDAISAKDFILIIII